MSIFEMSLYAGIFIFAVVLARFILKPYLPKRTFMVMWWIGIARLLVPISLPSKGNILSIFAALTTSTQPNTIPTGDLSNMDLIAGAVTNWGTEAVVSTSNISISTVIWLVGAVLVGAWFIGVHIRHRMYYKSALPLETDYIKSWQELYGTGRKIKIKYSDKIATPITYGIIKPVIVVPKGQCNNESDLELILTHEYIHIRNFDALTKYLLAICLAVHWFNPLVWLMYSLANRDIEIVCDYDLISKYTTNGLDIRKTYATVLLSLEEKRCIYSPFVSAFSKNPMEERVVSIMKSKKSTIVTLVISAVVVVVIAVIFATNKDSLDIVAPPPVPSSSVSAPEPNSEPPMKVENDKNTSSSSSSSEPSQADDQSSSSSLSPSSPSTPSSEEIKPDEPVLNGDSAVIAPDNTKLVSGVALKETDIVFGAPLAEMNISVPYGGDINHQGVDFFGKEGTEIYAIADGTVSYTQVTKEGKPDMPAYGTHIVIDHGDGYKSLYAHCSKLTKVSGDKVKKGELIGRVGSTGQATGTNLHLEVRVDTETINPMNIIPSK